MLTPSKRGRSSWPYRRGMSACARRLRTNTGLWLFLSGLTRLGLRKRRIIFGRRCDCSTLCIPSSPTTPATGTFWPTRTGISATF